jgi:hypothetical protein
MSRQSAPVRGRFFISNLAATFPRGTSRLQPSLRATPVTERASDSAKDCESLVDARQDGIGHDAEHGAEKDASSEEICQ